MQPLLKYWKLDFSDCDLNSDCGVACWRVLSQALANFIQQPGAVRWAPNLESCLGSKCLNDAFDETPSADLQGEGGSGIRTFVGCPLAKSASKMF